MTTKNGLTVLSFVHNNDYFRLPTIQAYNFSEKALDNFEQKGNYVPLALDINLQTPCNINCTYCYTSHGNEDRFEVSQKISKLNESELEEVLSQFGNLGGTTIFLCSEGEPLINRDYFMNFAKATKSAGLNLLTYTNATMLDKDYAEELLENDVNLVVKLESLEPEKNDQILRPRNLYRYTNHDGVSIPQQLKNVIDVYSDNRDKLAISTMLTGLNYEDIMPLRKYAYEKLGVAHFLKQLYIYGQADKNSALLSVNSSDLRKLEESLYEFDERAGFSYPMGEADQYSYDIRRFLNNHLNPEGFPARIFGHPRGGVYHNSDAVNVKFGFQEGHFVSMRDNTEKINMPRYFNKIYRFITNGY
ncbi:MAG: radical SAM protein [Candidatus Nanoarchaeia archaeon]